MFATSSESPSWKVLTAVYYSFRFYIVSLFFSQVFPVFVCVPGQSQFSLASLKISENWMKSPHTTRQVVLYHGQLPTQLWGAHLPLYLCGLHETWFALLSTVRRLLVSNQGQYTLFIYAFATSQSLQYLVHISAITKEAEKLCRWSLLNCWQKKTWRLFRG